MMLITPMPKHVEVTESLEALLFHSMKIQLVFTKQKYSGDYGEPGTVETLNKKQGRASTQCGNEANKCIVGQHGGIYTCNSSAFKVEEGRSEAQGHPWLHRESETSWRPVRPRHRQTNIERGGIVAQW